MSKDLIDSDEFTSPIHVPEGIDPRDDAAGDVELIAQRLANRTLNLKNRLDPLETDAARRSTDNHFLGSNSFDHGLFCVGTLPDEPMLFSNVEPATLGSAWRVIAAHKYAGGRYAEVNIGTNSTDTRGALLICTNAHFDKASQLWQQYDPAHGSTAIIWHRNRIRMSRVAAGTAPWDNWPTGFVVGQSAVAPNIVVDALVEGEYRYLAARSKPVAIPLLSAFGSSLILDSATGFLRTTDPLDVIRWPLRVPAGTVLVESALIVNQTTAANGTLTLVKSTPDFSSPFSATRTVVKTHPSTGGAGVKAVFEVWDNLETQVDTYYEVGWVPGNLADDVRGVRLLLNDAGPRSF